MLNATLAVLGLCAAIGVGAYLVMRARLRRPGRAEAKANASVYDGLRMQAMKGSRRELGLRTTPSDSPVWGVLMETAFLEGTATLISMSDGSASLYFSGGGGVIGGGEHEKVRAAAIEFVKLANHLRSLTTPVSEFPLPTKGRTAFYLRTDSGVLRAEASEEDLGERRHQLAPLFYAGHEVIGQLRVAAGEKQNE